MIGDADILVVRGRIADLARDPLLAPRERRHAETLGRAAAAFVAGRTLVRRLLARIVRDPIEIVEPPNGKPQLCGVRTPLEKPHLCGMRAALEIVGPPDRAHAFGVLPPDDAHHEIGTPRGDASLGMLPTPPDGTPRGTTGWRSELDFNVSHAGELVLVAIARGRRVGVDVEEVSHRRDVVAIAGGALGEDAALELRQTAAEHRAARFTSWWVRIEALCKATGAGLMFPVDTAIPGFAVRDIAVCAGYRAAVAFDGGRAVIRTHDWSTP